MCPTRCASSAFVSSVVSPIVSSVVPSVVPEQVRFLHAYGWLDRYTDYVETNIWAWNSQLNIATAIKFEFDIDGAGLVEVKPRQMMTMTIDVTNDDTVVTLIMINCRNVVRV